MKVLKILFINTITSFIILELSLLFRVWTDEKYLEKNIMSYVYIIMFIF